MSVGVDTLRIRGAPSGVCRGFLQKYGASVYRSESDSGLVSLTKIKTFQEHFFLLVFGHFPKGKEGEGGRDFFC